MFSERNVCIITNLIYFITSYLFVKVACALSRFVIACYFKIDLAFDSYVLAGVSKADSGVWNHITVIAFHSIDVVVLILISLASYMFYRRRLFVQEEYSALAVWTVFSAHISLLGIVPASIIAKESFYHALNWMSVSFMAMLIIAFLFFVFTAFSGLFVGLNFLNSMEDEGSDVFFQSNGEAYIYSFLIPVIFGLVILYLPMFESIGKYELVELFFVLMVLLSARVFLRTKGVKIYMKFMPVSKMLTFICIALYLLFVVVNGFLTDILGLIQKVLV